MSVTSAALALVIAAWVLTNLALFWALAGLAFGDAVPGNRVLYGLILLAVGALGNAYVLDQFGRYFGL